MNENCTYNFKERLGTNVLSVEGDSRNMELTLDQGFYHEQVKMFRDGKNWRILSQMSYLYSVYSKSTIISDSADNLILNSGLVKKILEDRQIECVDPTLISASLINSSRRRLN